MRCGWEATSPQLHLWHLTHYKKAALKLKIGYLHSFFFSVFPFLQPLPLLATSDSHRTRASPSEKPFCSDYQIHLPPANLFAYHRKSKTL